MYIGCVSLTLADVPGGVDGDVLVVEVPVLHGEWALVIALVEEGHERRTPERFDALPLQLRVRLAGLQRVRLCEILVRLSLDCEISRAEVKGPRRT